MILIIFSLLRSLIILSLFILFTSVLFSQTGSGGVEQTNGSSLLSFWLKADAGVYENAGTDTAESGDGVYQWNDKSGLNKHIQQTTSARRPIFRKGILNNLPVIRFTSSNSHFLGSLSLDAFQNNYSIFMVGYGSGSGQDYMAVTFPTNHGILLETSWTNNQLRFLHRNPSGVSGGDNLDAGNVSSSSSQLLSFTRGTPSSGNQQFWVNGSNNQSITANGNNFSSSGSLVLGRLGPTYSSRYLNGDIAEVIIISKEVNAAERIIIENYLSAKYGLSLGANVIYVQDNSSNGNFDHDVVGIGRVNSSNIHDDAQGAGMVRILNPSGLGDNEFLIWGHNNGIKNASNTSDIPTNVQARFDRVWRVSETNSSNVAVDVGSIDIRFDLSGLGQISNTHLRLLVDTDNDGVFNDETPISGATSLGNDIYQFSGVTSIANNTRFTIATSNLSQSALPVNLINFNVKCHKNNQVSLVWQTSSEVNNDYFSIQKSQNGIDWKVLEIIDGAGNSSTIQNYSAIDKVPYLGSSYYRLKQTDFDGQFEYSRIEKINSIDFINKPVQIYPNPSENIINIVGDKSELTRIKVFNQLGHEVTHKTKIISMKNFKLILDISSLESGSYLLETTTTKNTIFKN